MKLRWLIVAGAAPLVLAGAAFAASGFQQVKSGEFDPARTYLVQGEWLTGIGCPTGAHTSSDGQHLDGTYTDPACPTGDTGDRRNAGLLLAKTGPTANYASAVATLSNVKGATLTELGYDIRKPGTAVDPRGSHCGAGAPRFDITLQNGTSYFLGCNSPAATTQTAGNGWLRLRWGAAGVLMAYNAGTGALENISGKTAKSISIVFDEGQDTGPDNFGLAVLDNIDVNGKLVGASSNAGGNGNGGGDHEDRNDRGEHDDD